MKSLSHFLFRPVDIAFLAYFRIFCGAFIAGEMINQIIMEDYLNYTLPAFHFTYQFFPWVKPFPPAGMYVLFSVIILSALFVAVGWKYRLNAVILFLSYTTMFLMEKSEYVNHFYLYCTVAFLLILLPAHRALSLDTRHNPSIGMTVVPAWTYYLLIFQMSVVYFYAGIAKLHTDWLQARAMQLWMASKGDIPLAGQLLVHEYAPWILSYCGMIFDLFIVPALLWKRTRVAAFFVAVFFHMSNVVIFGLATFPWFSLMMTALYFGPSWPRNLPGFKKYLPRTGEQDLSHDFQPVKAITIFLAVYVFLQLTIPFRHWLYPYSPNWTEEGHRFSWHMMLRSKHPYLHFTVKTGEEVFTHTGEEFLTPHQWHKMAGDPDMILEFAHFLEKIYKEKGYQKVEVYATSLVSLNGYPMQALIDPKVNLAAEKRSLGHYPWIRPMKE